MHTNIHTHRHTRTPHYNMFVHTTLIQPNLFQRWAETSELLGRISSSDLDPESCVVFLCLVLFWCSVLVHMYVSVYSFFSFIYSCFVCGSLRPLFVTTKSFMGVPLPLSFTLIPLSVGTYGMRMPWVLLLSTEIPLLAPRWKYHLSNWPLSRGRLIPRLVWFFLFSVSVFTTGLVTDIYPPSPLHEVFLISFSPWSRVLSFSFRVYHSILIYGTVCTVLMSQ